MSEGVLCLTHRCRVPHCLTHFFDAVYWVESLNKKGFVINDPGENSGKALQKGLNYF